MKTKNEIQAGLAQCYGSETFYRHGLSGLVYTEGIHFLAESADCYWLLDAIGSYQTRAMRDPMLSEIQFWKLKVTGKKAILSCERDEDDVAFSQKIEFTNFPLEEITIYVENGTMLLPSER